MNEIKEEEVNSSSLTILSKTDSSKNEESNEEEDEQQTVKRRKNRLQTLRPDKTDTEIIFNKVATIKKKRLSISYSHRMNSLMHMNSSKVVAILKKSSNKLETDTPISNIIDPTYNFSLNYQLKETALKIFQAGIEDNQTKIKFICNYLYQLAPFNKIFTRLAKSKDPVDINKLEKILYNLTMKLKYEYIEKNKIIYLHGTYPEKFYIILKGEVDIIIPNEMEVMMTEYEYYYYILRLYKFQEHSLLEKVLNKNYDIYPLDKKLLEDWIQTGFNTLVNLEKESEMNRIKRKKKNAKTYTPNYTNTEELINHLEKQKKLNLLMLSQNVILLLEKIRLRNEKARDAKKNRALNKKKKDNKKNKNKQNAEENLKPNVGYVKLNGQMRKIFMNEDQIEVVEKCANEISQLIEMFSDDFNYQKYLNTLNRCEADKYISRVKPHFFDEDTNEMLDPELFILNKSQKNQNLNKVNVEEDEEDIFYKLKNLFGYKKNADRRKMELFNNRKKTIVYNYVLVNSNSTGESFGEFIYENTKYDEINPRIATVITKEICHLATLKRELYNKILKEFNENNLHLQFLFLYSIDLFKDCNKNNFMKNMSFFIKRTIRANEILFNQDDDLGDDRSLYFVESGSFTSYCNISINEIEVLFNNLNYNGLIPSDDAHEDNLFNKENHYFNQFKKKKIFLNLFSFAKKDMIGFNDALYNNKYIYTVKCQSSHAIVYEIKLKFFNLIINSEEKLYQVLERYEAIKRNMMMKFFLNAFNNKTNFYKFISFDNLEEEKEEKKVVHKNYFGKNPFRDDKNVYDVNNDRQNFKLVNTVNKVNDNIMELMPELKKTDIFTNTTRLTNSKNVTRSNFFKRKTTRLLTRNIDNKKLAILASNKSMNKFLTSSKNIKQLLQVSPDHINRTLKKKLSLVYSKEKKESLKVDTYNTKTSKDSNSLPIIMNTLPSNNNINLPNKEERLFTEYKNNKDKNKMKISFDTKTLNKFNSKEIIKNNEYSFASSILSESFLKPKVKSKEKSIKDYKNYLDNEKNNIEIKNKGMNKKEQIRLKNYLKDIPDFFDKNKNSKKIFFGMNKKKLYQNNVLFTDIV